MAFTFKFPITVPIGRAKIKIGGGRIFPLPDHPPIPQVPTRIFYATYGPKITIPITRNFGATVFGGISLKGNYSTGAGIKFDF